MIRFLLRLITACCIGLLFFAGVSDSFAQQAASDDNMKAGRYDNGMMWTFDYPPVEHFNEAYNFEPTDAWFEKARLGALRLPNCTASFVSPNGLVMTNHHCGRGATAQVSREGENLLDNGFMSSSLEEERPVEGLYVDQLIAIQDVTDEVYAALEGQETDAERATARREAIDRISDRITEEAGGEEASIVVQVINLYNGGRYSAYTFRRYNDIRLVMAPELQLGFFGGDSDNFTYPRYCLDMTWFRIYENGEPYEPEHYFKWSENGSKEGDAVFVIGNPGSTLRLETVAQLEFRRDVQEKFTLNYLNERIAALEAYYEVNPSSQLLNRIFGMRNSQKLYNGRVKGLNDPVIMSRRADTERKFLDDLDRKYRDTMDPDMREQAPYLTLIDDLAAIQDQKREYTAEYGAFLGLSPRQALDAATLRRALLAYIFLTRREAGVAEEALESISEQILDIEDLDPGLEYRLMTVRLNNFLTYLGSDDLEVTTVFQGRSPEELAEAVLSSSVLADATGAMEAIEAGGLSRDDPAIQVLGPFMQRMQDFQSGMAGLQAQEAELNAQHGRARFEIYGTERPPDATFSLRIADGVVKSYDYNGTHAPAFTTFHGLYDHYYSYGPDTEWDLPERWLNAPATFDRSTPMNLVTTNDIIGGNSGSPMVNQDLEVVGLVFDGNIEFLPSAFIYLTEYGRTVSVDSRGMMEALDEIYDMDRIVLELKTGQLAATEAEADVIIEQ